MVHSFAIAPGDKPTDLTKVQSADDRRVYAEAGFVALAEQKPRAEVAKSYYPEMGVDKDEFLRFFGYSISIENYIGNVDKEFAEAIAAARALKVDDHEVFDAIMVCKTKDSKEMLAYGYVKFGSKVLYLLIAQWRAPENNVDTDSYTTIEEIKALHRKEQQKREDDEREYLEAQAAKERHSQKVWGYPLLTLSLLVCAVVIYAPLAHSAGWLAIGYLGSLIVTAVSVIRTLTNGGPWAKISLGIGLANLMGTILCFSYLTHIGVIK
jgi:hypothetical protein